MTALADRLLAKSPYVDPVAALDWRAADPARPWLPPHLTPLPGLPEEHRLAFSRLEFARLAATGIWLEGLLIARAGALGRLASDAREARLLLQEIREEAGHSLMFLDVIAFAGLPGVRLLGDTRFLDLVARRLDPAGPAFWAMVFLGESITDALALRALRHADALCPVARQVLRLHHRDEARHMAAARLLLAARLPRLSPWRRGVFRAALPGLLRRFLDATMYPTAASLAALGLPDAPALAAAARKDPARRALAAACAAPALKVLGRAGLPVPA